MSEEVGTDLRKNEKYIELLQLKWVLIFNLVIYSIATTLVVAYRVATWSYNPNTAIALTLFTLMAVVLSLMLRRTCADIEWFEERNNVWHRAHHVRHEAFCRSPIHCWVLRCHRRSSQSEYTNKWIAEEEVFPPAEKYVSPNLLGEIDDTYNGLIYRLRHKETGEQRDYISVKSAIDAFLADHKEPWLFFELNWEGVEVVNGDCQDVSHWLAPVLGFIVHMRHYGYKLVCDDPELKVLRISDYPTPPRFEKDLSLQPT